MSNTVREYREGHGWSLRELSRRTGIGYPDLSLLERGLRPCYPGWRRRLARAFKLPQSVLFPEEADHDR
jgi:transcriptional regulator with XRE-family HTH domain